MFRYLSLRLMLGLLLCGNVQSATLPSGDYKYALDVEGRSRSYLVHVPLRAPQGPLPVVINLHGGGGSAEQHRKSSRMDNAADRDGYIAVYPNGTGILKDRLLTWNAGNCCGYSQQHHVNDVLFISRMIEDLKLRANVDPSRIYVAGHSNGGMMAHKIGEELPDQVAAIASVAGAHIPETHGVRAVSVLHIHSVDDPRAIYEGGLGPPFPLTSNRVLHPSVQDTISAWVKLDGCDAVPIEGRQFASGGHTATEQRYSNCQDGAEVVLFKLTGAGHGWPGGVPMLEGLVGPATQVIDANTEIWRFFSRHTLPSQ